MFLRRELDEGTFDGLVQFIACASIVEELYE